MMTLKQFRVKNFRSVMDSGWIECDDVTTLVGINEAGKSNLILALWKLNPAREGTIDLLHDMPTKEYSSWRKEPKCHDFIWARFELDKPLSVKVASVVKCSLDEIMTVDVKRYYDGNYALDFPLFGSITTIPSDSISNIIEAALKKIDVLTERTQGEAGIKAQAIQALTDSNKYIATKAELAISDLKIINDYMQISIKPAAKSEIFPMFESVIEDISKKFVTLKRTNPKDNAEILKLITDAMPTFVYYSNYGNLDAQIYLPHAVKLVNGESVPGFDNGDKVRTLRVLFEFVNLSPDEVLELGKNPETQKINPQTRQLQPKELTPEEIEEFAAKKEEREIMLQSASSRLTREFAEWWKQGEYKFRLHADGDYFRILVSDDKRPEEIALELRSTGLQWFLSFFLVFLVESKNTHKGAVLLLDEAGLT
jgi:hypothetical protein